MLISGVGYSEATIVHVLSAHHGKCAGHSQRSLGSFSMVKSLLVLFWFFRVHPHEGTGSVGFPRSRNRDSRARAEGRVLGENSSDFRQREGETGTGAGLRATSSLRLSPQGPREQGRHHCSVCPSLRLWATLVGLGAQDSGPSRQGNPGQAGQTWGPDRPTAVSVHEWGGYKNPVSLPPVSRPSRRGRRGQAELGSWECHQQSPAPKKEPLHERARRRGGAEMAHRLQERDVFGWRAVTTSFLILLNDGFQQAMQICGKK